MSRPFTPIVRGCERNKRTSTSLVAISCPKAVPAGIDTYVGFPGSTTIASIPAIGNSPAGPMAFIDTVAGEAEMFNKISASGVSGGAAAGMRHSREAII